MTKRAFGDLENSILNVLKSGKRATVKRVQEALGNKDKYTTIMTVMSRLVEKNLLGRERVGSRYEYWLLKDQKNPQSLLERLRTRLFGMKTADVVSYLINEADDLSPEDLHEVEKMIAVAKKKNVKGESNE